MHEVYERAMADDVPTGTGGLVAKGVGSEDKQDM